LKDLLFRPCSTNEERWELEIHVQLTYSGSGFNNAAREVTTTELPLPPPDLRFRVAGTELSDWFLAVGEMTIEDFAGALTVLGRDLGSFSFIYDFGCGCGRVTRWLRERAPAARLYGSDTDAAAIEWMQKHMPEVDTRVNNPLPPLPFDAASFDLVLGYSVFTHLDEHYQDAWLTELHRITKPGAVLLLTVHGRCHWGYTMAKLPETTEAHVKFQQVQAELQRSGFLHLKADGWGKHFPDHYHTSWHLPSYVRSHWSRWFDVRDVLEMKARPVQDMVILCRGDDVQTA
jgi:SAM-dependent methyltransferase